MSWTIGIDVGGTFTDLYAVGGASGERRTSKVLTTPDDRVLGVMEALRAAELDASEIDLLVHGTTTATNALIERKFPDVAMVTTEGFRDVLEIGRMHREHLYRPYQTKPKPLIKRRYRYVVDERTTARGEIIRKGDEASLDHIVRDLQRHEVKTVVICFINSYANPSNELAAAERIRSLAPEIAVVTSSDVKPIFREHSRFSTASVRAVLLPVMSEYFENLEKALAAAGFAGSLMVLKSNGGMMDTAHAKIRAEELVESGPAGGIGYAAQITDMTGFENIIHTDMGGTSFDTSILESGQGLITRDYEIDFDIPVAVPMLDIRSIGAGGGSIGWIDDGGSLRVGPRSAGSTPGPACYGRGGTDPTITDANLILGRLSPDLGGKFRLDMEAARNAVSALAEPLGLRVEECAEGMVRIATEAMAQAVKIVLASRGRDPRDYALASFGGAGPMHACSIAEALGTPSVVVPRYSGVASACGATSLTLKHDEEIFYFSELTAEALEGAENHFERLGSKAKTAIGSQIPTAAIGATLHVMRMRYAGQTFEVDVEVNEAAIKAADIDAIAEAFHEAHHREFGVRSDEFAIEIVALAITVSADRSALPASTEGVAPRSEPGHVARRPVYFDGKWADAPVHASASIDETHRIPGPAMIEDDHTCVVIPEGWVARVDGHKNCILEVLP